PVKMDSLLDMKNIIDECLQKKKTGEIVPFIVEDIWNDKIVGSTRLYDISLSSKTLEMGYTFFSPGAQRTSINTESKFLLLQYAFETLGVKRVQIKTDLRNKTAQKAIERLGAVKEGILRNERLLYNGLVRDAVVYSILDREWNVVKEKLESYITYSLAQS
ncbi:GNAT family protein, partial [Priestia megaterium]